MKRSSQVALLLMGVSSAGAATYAMMPTRECVAPAKPAVLAPGAINPQTLAPGTASGVTPNVTPGVAPGAPAAVPCEPSRRSSWGYRTYRSDRPYGYRSSTSSTQPTARRSLSFFSPSRSHTSVPSVGPRSASRSGFGSTGRSVSASSSRS